MNSLFALTKRNIKEILRDPLSLVFCLALPVFMLVIMQVIFTQIEYVPVNFKIENYAVGICVFGYTFAMLFAAMLISGDKNTEFINRIKMAPLSDFTYMLGYVLALLPIVLAQTVIFFVVSFIFGLPISAEVLLAIVYLLPSALLYISFGVLIGSLVKTEKQSGPVCSIIISIAGMFGGVFMPVHELGGLYTVVNLLPFVHSVDIASGVFSGDLGCIYPHILWVLGYTVVVWLAVLLLYYLKKKIFGKK